MDTENEKKQDQPEKKELTPQQLLQRKKMMVYACMGLIFAGVMWLIFAPSGSAEKASQEGLNTELPMPKEEGLPGDKKAAYEQDATSRKQNEKMRSLQDFAFMLGESAQQDEASDRPGNMPVIVPDDGEDAGRKASGLQRSANAYKSVNAQLTGWYDQPAIEDDQAQLELEWRIQELERRLEEKEQVKNAADEKLELMEKSLQMASKYMPGLQNPIQEEQPGSMQAILPTGKVSGKTAMVQPISQVRHTVVSILSAPTSGQEAIELSAETRNRAFHTVAGMGEIVNKNTIRACINQTVTLTDGKEVELRLLETMQVGSMIVPANTLISGTAKISGERMDILIASMQYAEIILPVNLSVYDMKGQKGLFIPGSDEINAMKEVGANMGSNLGSSINISRQGAGEQILADLGRGVIQGTSQYISKKMREIKVTVKAGDRLLLLPGS